MVRRPILAGCMALGLGLNLDLDLAADAAPPKRVVSMNLCTDQLAMLLAAPGQLLSVSYLAQDPQSSAMPQEAAQYVTNHGLAEEIVRMKPDLVLAGAYTTPATVAMLRRLDVPVQIFDPANDFHSLRANMRKMGEVLGRQTKAEAMVLDFDRDLSRLYAPPAIRPRAAIYYANGYTAGDHSLAGHIMDAAGLTNIAPEIGLSGGGLLSIEQLVLTNPDLLIRGTRFAGSSRSEDILAHPALSEIAKDAGQTSFAGQDWVCGTPHVLRAIARLRDARTALPTEAQP